MTLGDLILRIGADAVAWNALRSTLNDTKSELMEFAESVEKIGLVFDTAFTAPVEQLIEKVAEDFEQGTNRIRAATGATGEALNSLRETMTSVFTTSGVTQSLTELGAAVGELTVRLGLTGEPLEALTTQLAHLALITGEQIGPLVTDTARLFAQWSIATEDQAHALDLLLNVSQSSGASIKQLQTTLVEFGPALQELGFSFEQAAGLIGTLEKAGVNASTVMSSLNRALLTMSKAGLKDPIEGLELIVSKIQAAATAGEAFQIGALAFGKGATALTSAIREGKIDFEDFVTNLNLGTTSINEQAKAVETISTKFGDLKDKLEAALEPLGTELDEQLTKLIEALNPLVDEIKTLGLEFEKLDPSTKAFIADALLAAAAIGPLLGAIGLGVIAVQKMVEGLEGLAAVMGTEGIAGVFADAIPMIAGVAAGFEALKLQGIIDAMLDLYDAVKRNIAGFLDFSGAFDLLAAIGRTLGPIFDSIWSALQKVGAALKTISFQQWLDIALPQMAAMRLALEKLASLVEFIGGNYKSMNDAAAAAAAKVANINADIARAAAEAAGGFDKTTTAVDGVTKGVNQFSQAAIDAFNKLTKNDPFKAVQDQIKKLQEQVGEKSLPLKQLQLADLQRQVYHPTATDADKNMLDYFNEVIKLNRAAYIQTSDDTLAAQADLVSKLKIHGMDTAQAFSLLGVTSTADIDRQVAEVQAAYQKIADSSIATDDDITRAQIAAADKSITLWRSAGIDISDAFITSTEAIKASWATLHLDLGQAFGNLGVQSVQQVTEAINLQAASLAKIKAAVLEGVATQQDADNAEIASLQKKASEMAAIGKAMTDEEVSRLAQLETARKASAMTTEGAFQFLGIPSEDDLNNAVTLIQAAFEKIDAAESTTGQKSDQARAAELQKMIAAYRAAGEAISSDLIIEFQDISNQVKITGLDIQQAFQVLGTFSTNDAANQILLLSKAFDKVAEDATSSAVDIQNALVAKLSGTVAALQKAGVAASDELIHQLDDAQTKVKAAALNIDQAFQTVGVQSTDQLRHNLELADAALEKIANDSRTSTADLLAAETAVLQLQLRYETSAGASAQEVLATAQALEKAKISQQALSDSSADLAKLYQDIDHAIGTIWTDFGKGLGDAIAGASSFGDAMNKALTSIETKLSELVTQFLLNRLKNALLENTNLLDSWNKLFNSIFGGSGAGGSLGEALDGTVKKIESTFTSAANTVGEASAQIMSETTDAMNTAADASKGISEAADAAGKSLGKGADAMTSAADSMGQSAGQMAQVGSSIFNTLTSVINVVSGVVGAIAGIFTAVETAHTNTLLTRIEESTRRMDITLESSDGIAAWCKAGAQATIGIQAWGDGLFATLNAMLSDLDNIADFTHSAESTLKNIDAILANGDGGSSSSSDAMASHVKAAAQSLDVSSANLEKATQAFASTATSTGATQDDINQIMDDFTKNFMKNAQDQIAAAGNTLVKAADAVAAAIQGALPEKQPVFSQSSTSMSASDLLGPNSGPLDERSKAYYDAEAKAINAMNAYSNAFNDKSTDPQTLESLRQAAYAAEEVSRGLSGLTMATNDITKGIDVAGTTFKSTNASLNVMDAGIGAFGKQLFQGSEILNGQLVNLFGTADEILMQAAGLGGGPPGTVSGGPTGADPKNFDPDYFNKLNGYNPLTAWRPNSIPLGGAAGVNVPITVTGNSFMTTGQMDQIADIIMDKVTAKLSAAGLLR